MIKKIKLNAYYIFFGLIIFQNFLNSKAETKDLSLIYELNNKDIKVEDLLT